MVPDSMEKVVLRCVAENYGMAGSLERLTGENLNYLFTTVEGMPFVVKIVDDDMPPEVVEMEFEAMEYAISAGFSLQLPRIIQNKDRRIETRIILHRNSVNRLRLLSFIDGIVLETLPDISDVLLKNVGISLAEYNLAMQGFALDAAHRSHRWNLEDTGRHRGKIRLVKNLEKQALLSWGFDTWEQNRERLKSLPRQFIHGDLNRENILVKGDRVTGLVDFGDSCMNPTICDLAICLSYIMMDRQNPLETAALVTRSYHDIRPLREDELSVLYSLICGRLATTIAVSRSRRSIDPDNPNWFGSEDSAWSLLGTLRDTISQREFFLGLLE